MKTMKGVRRFASITFACAAIPLLLNDGLPNEGTLSMFLVMFGGGFFTCTVGWYIGCIVRGAMAASKIEEYKHQLIESGHAKLFYKEYENKSHFCKYPSAQFAPEAIKQLMDLGYPKDQVMLDVSHIVVNYDCENADYLVLKVVEKLLKDMLQA